jgi:hypothetical protein
MKTNISQLELTRKLHDHENCEIFESGSINELNSQHYHEIGKYKRTYQ